MKPTKGQSRSDWMKSAVPHLVEEGKSETDAIKEASDLYEKEGDGRREAMQLKAKIRRTAFKADEISKLCADRGITYKDGDENNVAVFEVSNERVDRDGDILLMGGIDTKNFMANPVILFAHDYYRLPIGACLKLEVVDGKMVATVLFQDITDEAIQICALVKAGFLRATSIGFRPKQNGVKFPTEAERVSMAMRPGGVIFTSVELYEITVCPVPANQEALAREVAKSLTPSARKFGAQHGLFTVEEDFTDLDTEFEARVKAEADKRVRAVVDELNAERVKTLREKFPNVFSENKADTSTNPRMKKVLEALAKVSA